jgi:micrococcal nuclease
LPAKIDRAVSLKTGRLAECSKCKTTVWNSKKKRGKQKQYCPDCRTQKDFSESKLNIVHGELPDPVDSVPSSPGSGFPGFFAGVILGAIGALAAAVFSGALIAPGEPPIVTAGKTPIRPVAVDNTDTRQITLIKTPSGDHEIARPADFLMEGKIFTVLKVIDGDTMHIKELPNNTKVRLLGVDTPETKHVTKGVQFWGREASDFTKQILNDQKVIIKVDIKHLYGVFGRPLVYLELLDGRDFNGLLISEGYARATVEYPFDRMASYKKLEEQARLKNKGMWNQAGRDKFNRKKAAAIKAAKEAEILARKKEIARRQKLVKEAVAKGGQFIKGKKSKSIHQPWCNRKPKKNVVYFSDLQQALNQGCRKHNCFK